MRRPPSLPPTTPPSPQLTLFCGQEKALHVSRTLYLEKNVNLDPDELWDAGAVTQHIQTLVQMSRRTSQREGLCFFKKSYVVKLNSSHEVIVAIISGFNKNPHTQANANIYEPNLIQGLVEASVAASSLISLQRGFPLLVAHRA